MIRKTIHILLLAFFIVGKVAGHSGNPQYHVIIDTDGGVDDMRSVSMFLSMNDIRVLSITCSQGNLLPDSVFFKVRSLLSAFHHEGIRVGIGDETGQDLPYWSDFVQDVPWGRGLNESFHVKTERATPLLNSVMNSYREKVTLIALGSLKTYADWFRSDPEVIEKVDRILWFNTPVAEEGFNFKASPESYNYIRQSGVELTVVSDPGNQFTIDETYMHAIRKADSHYARQIEYLHTLPCVEAQRQQRPFQLWDDIVPLYLAAPVLFDFYKSEGVTIASLNPGIPASFVYEMVGTLLESATTANNRVLKTFPVDSTLYKPEYAKILHSTLKKYGLIEWKAISLTNEIHGHTGIYSIMGAKMGVRAMEFFNVGVNNMTVTTFAGNEPPLSCFNDGLQISTGATIGQGLITVSDTVLSIPTTVFEFNSKKVKISLKPEIADQMQEEIAYGVQTYGLLTDEYWLYIKDLAVTYWEKYNRFEIFNYVLL